jgi:hypothetical protein
MYSPRLVQVEGQRNMYRDLDTNAIVYRNDSEYQDYIERRKNKVKKDELLMNTAKDLEEVKKDISELKSLLKSFIDKNNN